MHASLNRKRSSNCATRLFAFASRGFKVQEIAKILGTHPSQISRWWQAYQRSGTKALACRKRGRKLGSGRHLDAEQERQLRQMIRDKTPDQLKLALRCGRAWPVQQVIRHQWGLRMPIRTVGEYLRRWGFTPQKPIRRAYEQNPKVVRKWLAEQYPAIAQRAKREDAEIHWGDETGLSNGYQYGRSYAPRGQTPTVRICARKESIGLVSHGDQSGPNAFYGVSQCHECHGDEEVPPTVGQRCPPRKVFLIVDNLKVHHSKPVKEVVGLTPGSDRNILFASILPRVEPR